MTAQPKNTRAYMRVRRDKVVKRFAFTPQTQIAALSATILVAIAVLLVTAPVPFVIRGSGESINLFSTVEVDSKATSITAVDGAVTYPHTGEILLLPTAITPSNNYDSLAKVLIHHWFGKSGTLPRDHVYIPGKTESQRKQEATTGLRRTLHAAAVAGLRHAGVKVTSLPVVSAVTTAGPSFERLRAGDYVLKINGRSVNKPEELESLIAEKKVNEVLTFIVLRDAESVAVDVTVSSIKNDHMKPTIGAKFEQGYSPEAAVNFVLTADHSHAEDGLAMALAVYEMTSPDDLIAGRKVAAIGEIDGLGNVSTVVDVNSRLSQAEANKIDILVIPERNCADLVNRHTSVRLVPVSTLSGAITALTYLNNSDKTTEVATCS
ncbi:MAG: PDZ domain-containing protein [Propionibacteriaceae bacterium]